MLLFFDTSAVFAWFSRRDGNHNKASSYMELFRDGKTGYRRLVLTDAVLAEVIDLTQIKLGKKEAIRLGGILMGSSVVEIVDTINEDRLAAWRIMEKYKDQDSNYTDSLSFAAMERLGMGVAFTFDEHFAIHGFTMVP